MIPLNGIKFSIFVIMDAKTLELRSKIIKGFELTFEKLIEFKKKINSKIVVSKNDKILYLNPEDFKK